MKILLDEKYVMDMETLNKIIEVEKIGYSYSDQNYKIIGEPKSVAIVHDSRLLGSDEATHKEEEFASIKLKEVEAELAKFKLDAARAETVKRLMTEGGFDHQTAFDFMQTHTYIYSFKNLTKFDVLKWQEQGAKS